MNLALCPSCNSKDSTILFDVKTDKSEFHITQCRRCDLARTFPLPDDNVINVHDRGRYYGKNESKFIPIFQNIRDRLSRIRARKYLSMIPKSIKRPKILDIGCAEGRLLKSFLENGCDCYGIEHPSYPEKRFLNRDKIKYFIGDLDFLDKEERSFDIIILWHVLEHMDNPDAAISGIYDLLDPGGVLILAVPNFSSIESNAFKEYWFHLDVPWHKYHFTKKSLCYLMEKNNFEIINSSTFCIEQGIYGLLQSFLNVADFPKNELYEAMKGNYSYSKALSLFIQSFIGMLILGPCFLISIFTSATGQGSVIKLILRKGQKKEVSLKSK